MQTSIDIEFRVAFQTNVESHVRWIEYMLSSDFPQEIFKRWGQSSHLDTLVKLGRSVIEEQIYSVSMGEGKIAESVTATLVGAGDAGGLGGTTVFLNPAISGAKGPVEGMDESKLSYAAFFERPEFNSFLLGKGEDITNPIKYRPFFDTWTVEFFQEEEKQYLRSILAAVKHKLPRHTSL